MTMWLSNLRRAIRPYGYASDFAYGTPAPGQAEVATGERADCGSCGEDAASRHSALMSPAPVDPAEQHNRAPSDLRGQTRSRLQRTLCCRRTVRQATEHVRADQRSVGAPLSKVRKGSSNHRRPGSSYHPARGLDRPLYSTRDEDGGAVCDVEPAIGSRSKGPISPRMARGQNRIFMR
jgi:hypothetical protein